MRLNAPHVCKICQKGFWFPMNLTVHERTHSHQGLFQCTNCPNMYTTQATINTHRVTHKGQKITCPKCPYFSTDTQPNLRQHHRGKHGKGWHSPADDLTCHLKCLGIKKCQLCKNIKEREQSKAEKFVVKLSKK